MDNKNYNATTHADEYRLPESGSEDHFATGTESKASASIFERINRRHILFGFLLVFLIYLTYQLLSKVFHVLEAKREALVKEVAAAQNKSHLTTLVPQAKPVEPPQNEVKKLTQGQVALQSTLNSLTTQLSDIQSSLSNLHNQLAQMGDEMQTLQARQALLLKKATPPPVKEKIIKKEVPKPIYYVRAIIPGRVWLTTPSGTTLTLGLGDSLAGYGSIESINPEQGLITLSSGATIGYSPDDR
ncbi:hypothetical protein [Rickettsiella massiliensis]|uniref:hypothetical protein n=1 Tax=Rickettsiella massiliensis TaxID=676517 RepID=UPI00029AAB1C|nr:hypothetical protein [Rickettsiella massiliensis]